MAEAATGSGREGEVTLASPVTKHPFGFPAPIGQLRCIMGSHVPKSSARQQRLRCEIVPGVPVPVRPGAGEPSLETWCKYGKL